MNTVDAANPNVPSTGSDAATLASSLAQLTSGWTAAPGVARQSLTVARQAIAASLLAGKSIADLYAAPARVRATPQANPKLAGELLHLANAAIAPASAAHSCGDPQLIGGDAKRSAGPARMGARRADSPKLRSISGFPRRGALGRSHPLHPLIPFAFGSAATPFGVFPYHGSLGIRRRRRRPCRSAAAASGFSPTCFLQRCRPAISQASPFLGGTLKSSTR